MKAKVDDEDQRIRKAISEKEDKFISEEAEKEKKRQEMLKSIDVHRQHTMKLLEDEQRINKQRDLDSLLARKEADAILKENEAKRQRIRLTEAKKLAQEYLDTAVKL